MQAAALTTTWRIAVRSAIRAFLEIALFFGIGIPFAIYVWPHIQSALKASIYADLGYGFVWLLIVSGAVAAFQDVRVNSPKANPNPADNRAVGSLSDDGYKKTKQDYSILQMRLIGMLCVAFYYAIVTAADKSRGGLIAIVGGTAIYLVLFAAEKLSDRAKQRKAR